MEEFVCKYCGKVCKNQNSLTQHEIRCKQNPDKIIVVSNFIDYNKKVKSGEIVKEYKNDYVKAERKIYITNILNDLSNLGIYI